MADLFQCDKCGTIASKDGKRARLILQELGPDGNPHPAHYNRKAEVCGGCFDNLKVMMNRAAPVKPSFAEASDITREASAIVPTAGERS